MHLIIDFKTHDNDWLTNVHRVRYWLLGSVQAGGLTPVGVPVVRSFGPGLGCTAFIPLAESHLAIHTWHEGFSNICCFSCRDFEVGRFIHHLLSEVEITEGHAVLSPRGVKDGKLIPVSADTFTTIELENYAHLY